MSFVHLHLHTGFSFHESPIRIEDLAQRSRELGYSSCAITDSNTLAGAIRFDRAARSAGITPVFGTELTLLSDEPDDHVVVLARCDRGSLALTFLELEFHGALEF